MPHATLPSPGFQAIILCGPGLSLNTFTSHPRDFPKALIPIANRPMVWYPLDWCYRMGVTDITLITPPESAGALESALAQNPHLTSLPAPKPEVSSPANSEQTTGTGEIFRLPEVQKAITQDFIVSPCDSICELEGTSLSQSWMVSEAGLGGATGGVVDGIPVKRSIGGEESGRRGGLGVWYPTTGLEGVSTKNEETDFIATTAIPPAAVPAPEGSLREDIEQVVLTMPTSTVKDVTDEKKSFPLRHSLSKRHGKIKMKTTHRDAHIYFFPFWVMEMIQNNETFDSVAEDVLGWWAKAGWQEGLGDKLGLRDIFEDPQSTPDAEDPMAMSMEIEEEIDVESMSSTSARPPKSLPQPPESFASRVPDSLKPALDAQPPLTIPPILAYVQPALKEGETAPSIRRVDTGAQLLSISLRLAKSPSLAEASASGTTASPFAHPAKVAHPDMMKAQSRVSEPDSLIAENVTIESRVNIKECVIGVGCTIGMGSRLTRCLLMEGAVVGENVTLTNCILGRRCKVEGGGQKDDDKTRLTDCEVSPGYIVEWGTESKNEKFMAFEGLEDDAADFDMGDDGEEAVESFGLDPTDDLGATGGAL